MSEDENVLDKTDELKKKGRKPKTSVKVDTIINTMSPKDRQW